MVQLTHRSPTPTSPYLSDDGHWEDIEDIENHPRPSPPSTSMRIGVSSPRKRRATHRPAYVAALARKPPPVPPPTQIIKSHRNVVERKQIIDGAFQGFSFTFRYILDIFVIAIRMLRWPLALFLFFWLLAFMVGKVTNTLQNMFHPLCFLPGLHGSRICVAQVQTTESTKAPRWADYPQMVEVQSTTFEHLLDESVSGSGLSLEIKKVEMAAADLAILVRISNLSSRETLGDMLVEFIGDAKKTGRDLQKLSSKIGGAVDSIMAVNDYALHQIEAARSSPRSISNMYGLIPTQRHRNEVILRTFEEAMSVLSNSLQRLILEAEADLMNLEKLEERLSLLHEVVAREDIAVSAAKFEILAELWTILGGNRNQLRNFDENLRLLKNLGLYRQKALAHVAAALQALKATSSDMEDLRERVSAPELTGSKIPVEVHMKSIEGGLQRLRDGRVRSRKLEDDAIRRVLGITSEADE